MLNACPGAKALQVSVCRLRAFWSRGSLHTGALAQVPRCPGGSRRCTLGGGQQVIVTSQWSLELKAASPGALESTISKRYKYIDIQEREGGL